MMHYDELLKILGEFGRYQKFQYFLVCLVSITSSFQSMNMVFVGPTPSHHCHIPDLSTKWENLNTTQKLDLAIPVDDKGERESCRMFNISALNLSKGNYENWLSQRNNLGLIKCTHGWTYSTEYYKSTIVSEWDMVCDHAWIRSTASTLFFAGRLVGALICGQLSDVVGRRPVFFAGIFIQVTAGFVAAFTPVMGLFLCLYFIQGVAQVAVYLSSYVLGTEMVGPRYRKITGFFVNYFYAVGQLLLTAIAYWLREWRYIEIAISAPCIFFISYYWLLPESSRWLLTQGKLREAEKLLRKTARINKVKLSEQQLDTLEVPASKSSTFSILDLFKHWKIALIALNIWFCWMVNALVYYGLSLNSSNLAGDPYLNFVIAAGVEIPSLTVALLIIERSGRRWLTFVFMILAAVCCGATSIVPQDMSWLATTFSMAGKFAITASYCIIYLVAAEVFPTVVRNSGLGMASVFARVGGMIAPQLVLLGEYLSWLPLVLFGILSAVSAILVIFLPESTGKPLPQTMDDLASMDNNCSEQEDTNDQRPGNLYSVLYNIKCIMSSSDPDDPDTKVLTDDDIAMTHLQPALTTNGKVLDHLIKEDIVRNTHA